MDSKKCFMCYGLPELFYAFLWIRNQMAELTPTFITQMIDRGWLCWWNRSLPQDTSQQSHPKSYTKANIGFDGPCSAGGLENYYSWYFRNTMARRYFFTFKMKRSLCVHVCVSIRKTEWELILSFVCIKITFYPKKVI